MATSQGRALRSSRALFVSFIGLVAAASFAACGAASSQVGAPPANGRHPSFVVSKGSGAYLGAHVNPSGSPASWQEQETETEDLELALKRNLAIHNEYRQWSDLAAINGDSSDPEIAGDIKNGRVPMIALACADNMTQDYNGNPLDIVELVSPQGQADLQKIKTALSTLVYPSNSPYAGQPYPIMLRWFWEFNLNVGNPSPPPNNNDCFELNNPESQQLQFTNAWQFIYGVLRPGQTRIPNITFVWNPTVAVAASDGNPPDPAPYYPGNSYVDWIAADGYSKEPMGGGNPHMFGDVFGTFFSEFSNSQYLGKPISITETGSCQEYLIPYDQGSYITGAANLMSGGGYPLGGSFMYFDAPGSYLIPPLNHKCHWTLSDTPPPPGVSGFQAFKNMGANSYFSQFILPPGS